MRKIFILFFALLIFPSISIGETESKKQTGDNKVPYQEAISLSGLSERLANKKLVTHFPDMSSMTQLGRSPDEVCENLAQKGVKCWLEGAIPFIDTGFTLGEFCHSILNNARRCLFKNPLELQILPPDKDEPSMYFFFENLNTQVLVVDKLKSSRGHVSNGQEAGMAIRWLYSPKF